MYDYKVGDKFTWKEDVCFIESFLNDVYELAQRKNGDYYVKTIYSEYNDYSDWEENKHGGSYEDICETIDRSLEKIDD